MTALAGGGAERVMLALAACFAERDIEVDIVVTDARGALLDDVPRNVRLVNLGSRRIIMSLLPLVRYLRRERPDALLAALAPTNCIAVWARAIARVPLRLVVTEHNTLSKSTVGATLSRARLLPPLMRYSYPLADAIVAVSAGVAEDLAATIGLPRARIDVIHNPVVSSSMLEKSHAPIHHPWFKRGEPPVILGVGRLTKQKDFPLLIRAFARLRAQKEARLMILGEGDERAYLQTLVTELKLEEDVSLSGFVSNPYAYMRQAAVFVLSSGWEGFGNVLVEAMACGTPVVSTDCPSGPSEILENGKWGKLVPVGDELGMAQAIYDLLRNPRNDPASRGLHFTDTRAAEVYWSLIFRDERHVSSEQ